MGEPEKKKIREIVLITKPDPHSPAPGRWEKTERISKALSLAAVPVVIAIGGWFVQRQIENQAIRRDYVQLAVSILSEADTTERGKTLNNWAVDLLNDHSPTKLPEELLKDLRAGRTTLPTETNSRPPVYRAPENITEVVIGDTGGKASPEATLVFLKEHGLERHLNYIIGEDGRVLPVTDELERGALKYASAIRIELVHKFGEEYPEGQLRSLTDLLRDLQSRYRINRENIKTQQEADPIKRTDLTPRIGAVRDNLQ